MSRILTLLALGRRTGALINLTAHDGWNLRVTPTFVGLSEAISAVASNFGGSWLFGMIESTEDTAVS